MFKGRKRFKHLVNCNKIIVMVAQLDITKFIFDGEISEKRARWITKIFEYDMEISSRKQTRGRASCQHLAEDVHSNIWLLATK